VSGGGEDGGSSAIFLARSTYDTTLGNTIPTGPGEGAPLVLRANRPVGSGGGDFALVEGEIVMVTPRNPDRWGIPYRARSCSL